MERLGDFSAVQHCLEDQDSEMGAAEAHGLASGMLCANPNTTLDAWLQAVFETGHQTRKLQPEEVPDLIALFEGTSELLQNDQFGFDLLFPEEGATLNQQARALGDWCQGFLYGLACGGMTDQSNWAEDSQGILHDLSEIAKLDDDTNEQDEDERALTELREYVRVAVQIILMELQSNHVRQQLH